MKATVVTALYDIGREKIDGRSMHQYYEWFSRTLQLGCSMVIYCEESLNNFIHEHRPSHLETKVINQMLEEIPYYYLKDRMDKVLNDADYKKRVKDCERIECKTSLYSIIQYSKFPWVLRAAEENHFNSDYFFWFDAGASRFIPDIDMSQAYPGRLFLDQVKNMPETALFQLYVASYPDLALSPTPLDHDYLYDNRSFVWGGMFGADKSGIATVKNLVEEVLVSEMIDKNVLNNEQIAIGYLIKKGTKNFAVLQNNFHIHRNFELMYQTFM